MPWRDRLLPAAFRGARFEVESHSAEAAGRRLQVHEYPGRDTPYAEDLGRRTTEFEVTAYVVGDEYTRDRDALIDAGAAPSGPPWWRMRARPCPRCGKADIDRLPEIIARPRAVLYDADDPDVILLVFDPTNAAAAGRAGKAVVRVGFSTFIRENGRRRKVSTNSLRTAGYVPEANLRERRYKLLDGEME